MKVRTGSVSILAISLLFGLSTLALPQTQAKSSASDKDKKTEIKAESKTSEKDSSNIVKKTSPTHVKHSKTDKPAAKETKTDKKLQ
jgi:hypothetical protein